MAARFLCGDVTRLNDLLDDRLTADEQAEITAHLETCEACRRAFDALAGGSRWWGELREFLPPDPPPGPGQTPTLQIDGTRDGRAGDPTRGESPTPDDDALDFLAPALSPGHLGRFGPYEVSEVLGRGGMGVVFKAFDPALHRPVAVKVLAPHLATSASARKRFLREARAAASVVHEHVVTIHAVDEAAGLPYLVMQFVSGRSLQERIDAVGPLELKGVLRIGMQAASGLAAAHALGLVHRDVKPSNILLENGVERVKLTDFGLARAVDDASLTQSGVVTGTPQYMAPEQARGEPVDHRADLFSLGSVLYAMCTGRSPFRAETTVAVLRRVCDETPRPVREINPEVPERLADLIARLHAKDPADRPQTAAEVADQLGRQLARLQQPSHLGPVYAAPGDPDIPAAKTAPRARRFARRPVLAAAALLAVLFGGLGLAEATGVADVSAMLATVLRIPTRDGTLLIEVNDPEVRVDVDGDDVSIRGAGVKALRLRAGPHQLRASRGGVPLSDRTVVITRGDKQVVKVGLEPDRPAPADDQDARPETGRGPTIDRGGSARQGGDVAAAGGATVSPFPNLKVVERFRLEGHTDWVYAVAYSPDGKTIASAGLDTTIELWDVASRKERMSLAGHRAGVRAIAFSPDGKRLASAGEDATVNLWDVEKGVTIGSFKRSSWVWSLAFSHDGATLASAGGGPAARRPDSRGVARAVVLRDLATGRERVVVDGEEATTLAVAFSPDGKTLGVGSEDGRLRLWDVASGHFRATLLHPRGVRSIAFSPDAGLVASGGAGPDACMLWDSVTGERLARFQTPLFGGWGLALSPDGATLAATFGTWEEQKEPGAVKLWDVASRRERATLRGFAGPAWSVTFSPDGRELATGDSQGIVKIWDVTGLRPPGPEADAAASKTAVEVRRFNGHGGPVRSVAFSPDGRLVLSGSGYPDGDETMRLWDAATGKEVRRFEGNAGDVLCVAFSPDGRRALSAGQFGVAILWDVPTGAEVRRFEGHKTPVEAVAFTPDGLRALTAGHDKTARVWDVETGKELSRFEGHTDRPTSLAVLPDGRRALTGSWDGTARVWELETGRELKRLVGSTAWVNALAVVADGCCAVTGSADGVIRVWDPDSGRLLKKFTASSLPILCLAVSPGGLVLSNGQDHSARLRDPQTGRGLLRLRGHPEAIWGVAFSPDGRRALTGGGGVFADGRWMPGKDWAIRLWDLSGADRKGPPVGKSPAPAAAEPVDEVRRLEGR